MPRLGTRRLRSPYLGGMPNEEWMLNQSQNSLDDLKGSLHDVLTSPRTMAHLSKNHQVVVQTIYETADSCSRRKRRKVVAPDPANEQADVAALQDAMDKIRLKCWP